MPAEGLAGRDSPGANTASVAAPHLLACGAAAALWQATGEHEEARGDLVLLVGEAARRRRAPEVGRGIDAAPLALGVAAHVAEECLPRGEALPALGARRSGGGPRRGGGQVWIPLLAGIGLVRRGGARKGGEGPRCAAVEVGEGMWELLFGLVGEERRREKRSAVVEQWKEAMRRRRRRWW